MLDKKSLKILKILQEKARIPNTEVSRQVGLAPSAVLERIRKMESQGIIDGYEVRLNPEKFSRNQVAFVNVDFDGRRDTAGAIGKNLAAIEEIQEVHYIAGDDSYLVKLRVADTRELGNVLRDKILTIEGVLSTKTSTVLETYKETANIPIR
jgi:Lrp/AsnC family leucine-responsive transcriptional regulator